MKLFKHQQAAKEFIIRLGGSGCLFMDVGTGKTLTTLAILKHYRQFSDCKLLVVCPLSLVKQAWEADVKKHTDFTIAYYKDYVDEDIMTINFEALIREKQFKMIEGATKGWICVIDEAAKLKNNRSAITKTMHRLRDQFRHRIILTANPTPNSLDELWGQVNFVVPDFLGNNFYSFRSYFFELRRGKETANRCAPSMIGHFLKKGFKFAPIENKTNKLLDRVKEISFYKKKIDCLDLPEELDQIRQVTLGKTEALMYKQMKKNFIYEHLNVEVVALTALTKLMKLRQITSGFGYQGDAVVNLGDDSKLKELRLILEELGNEQAIIWINFKEEQKQILKELGSAAVIASEEGFNAFREGKNRYLVINPKSCAHGLTFTNCCYEIFYSLSYSYEEYQQSRGRIHRIGQKRACTYIHILAEQTIDFELLEVVRGKRKVEELVHRYVNG